MGGRTSKDSEVVTGVLNPFEVVIVWESELDRLLFVWVRVGLMWYDSPTDNVFFSRRKRSSDFEYTFIIPGKPEES